MPGHLTKDIVETPLGKMRRIACLYKCYMSSERIPWAQFRKYDIFCDCRKYVLGHLVDPKDQAVLEKETKLRLWEKRIRKRKGLRTQRMKKLRMEEIPRAKMGMR